MERVGMLDRMKALSVQHQPLRRGCTSHDELTASVAEPSQKADDSQSAEKAGSELALPEDILFHIHSLMLMRDAARAACVSRVFLNSWRCYPMLTLDTEALGIHLDIAEEDKIASDFVSRVDHIMQNHSGMGLKKVKIQTQPCRNLHPSYVHRWLQIAISPGIEEFELQIYRRTKMEYDFPSSLLTSQRGSSLRSFVLTYCAFHSTMDVGCLSSLTRVYLRCVHITGDELYCFLSSCPALEQLDLSNCNDIIVLKIPHLLMHLNLLGVQHCNKLKMIGANAPKLRDFNYTGMPIHISLGKEAVQLRVIEMYCEHESNMIYYARTKLPSVAPNLQALHLSSCDETVNIPMIIEKFNHLRYLEMEIVLQSSSLYPGFDFHSLVSFLDASPVLETFILRVEAPALRHDVVLEYSDVECSRPGCLLGYRHEKLRNMMITGFCSAKSMFELTNHILEKTVSLECLTLDTTRGHDRRLANIDECLQMSKEAVMEAEKACLAIRRHIQGRVPSTVNLKVIEPCSMCHTLDKCYDALQYAQFH